MDPSRGDSRYNLNYSMSSIGLSLSDQADLYGNPAAAAALGGRPPSGGLMQAMGGGTGGGIGLSGRSSGNLMSNSSQCQSLSNTTTGSAGGPGQNQQQQARGIKRTNSDCYDDHLRGGSGSLAAQMQGLDGCSSGGSNQQQQQGGGNVPDVVDDSYNSMQNKKSPPANGKKTKGRVKIKMEYIDNKLRRYTTFSKRKTGIMKKAYELSTLTGTQVMLLVASETGHVYTFATRKLQPMITSEAGKQLIQTCLNSPDPPSVGGGDQRMSATGFEETELSYNIADEDSKDDRSSLSSPNESDESSDVESPLQNDQIVSTHINSSSCNKASESSAIPATSTTTVANGHSKQQQQQNTQLVDAKSLPLMRPNPSTSTSLSVNQYENNNVVKSNRQSLVVANKSNQNALAEGVNSYNNIVYPSSTLSSIPQEVLLQLIQSGHLQVHTEEDGSGHQYITIPLSLPSSSSSSSAPLTSSNFRTIGNTKTDFDGRDSLSINAKTNAIEGVTSAVSRQNALSIATDLNIKEELID